MLSSPLDICFDLPPVEYTIDTILYCESCLLKIPASSQMIYLFSKQK